MIELVLNQGVDMVMGDRLSSTYFIEKKRLFHNSENSIVRFSTNKLFKTDIKDIITGHRAFSYQFLKSFPVNPKEVEIETEMTIYAVDKRMYINNVIVD